MLISNRNKLNVFVEMSFINDNVLQWTVLFQHHPQWPYVLWLCKRIVGYVYMSISIEFPCQILYHCCRKRCTDNYCELNWDFLFLKEHIVDAESPKLLHNERDWKIFVKKNSLGIMLQQQKRTHFLWLGISIILYWQTLIY